MCYPMQEGTDVSGYCHKHNEAHKKLWPGVRAMCESCFEDSMMPAPPPVKLRINHRGPKYITFISKHNPMRGLNFTLYYSSFAIVKVELSVRSNYKHINRSNIK